MRTKSSIVDLYSATVWYSQIWFAVNPSRPSSQAFQENCPSNASIFVSLPVFLWFSAHSERYWAIWLQVNKALKVYKITKRRQNHKNLSFARLCARLTPVVLSKKRPSLACLYKNEPVWRIGYTAFPFIPVLLLPLPSLSLPLPAQSRSSPAQVCQQHTLSPSLVVFSSKVKLYITLWQTVSGKVLKSDWRRTWKNLGSSTLRSLSTLSLSLSLSPIYLFLAFSCFPILSYIYFVYFLFPWIILLDTVGPYCPPPLWGTLCRRGSRGSAALC